MGLGGDLVALWEVPLNDGVHKIGFEHGTTTGRRVLWVDGEDPFYGAPSAPRLHSTQEQGEAGSFGARRSSLMLYSIPCADDDTVLPKERVHHDWMFKLVGSEVFEIGNTKCVIKIEPVGGFSYEYSLEVNGKSYKRFTENQSKILKTWLFLLDGSYMRVVLEKDTLDVWVNGNRLDTAGEFVDDGTETHFDLEGHPAYIKATCLQEFFTWWCSSYGTVRSQCRHGGINLERSPPSRS